jgi:hypothetical protein
LHWWWCHGFERFYLRVSGLNCAYRAQQAEQQYQTGEATFSHRDNQAGQFLDDCNATVVTDRCPKNSVNRSGTIEGPGNALPSWQECQYPVSYGF